MIIDIIIPTRNAPESLWLCLTHLWAYGFTADVASVVLLDNCSTDPRTADVLRLAQGRPRHQVVRHERNVGVWCSVNRGLALSRAPLAMVVTSDVLLGPGTLPTLLEAQRSHRFAFLGPDVVTGLGAVPALARTGGQIAADLRYNGACWLMDWPRLRREIGWFDPRFYVCFGDTDYVTRLEDAGTRSGDRTLLPVVLTGLPICHLDKQSRRADGDASRDTDMELRDGERFRQKWGDRADVLARHPELPREAYLAFKGRDLGGWDEARVR